MGDTWKIVLLGKTGAGKSSLANTIFGDLSKSVKFKVNHSANSETKVCQTETRCVNGRNLQLIDTPGLFDTKEDNTELKKEVLRSIIECAPGLHAFLILLKVEKFTMHERAVVESIQKQFSEDVLKYTTVVFTHGDQLEEGKKIEEWAREIEALRKLVDKCGGRCHVFDNRYWNNSQDQYRNNQVQVKELLETIDKTVRENGGRYYTNEMLQMVEEDIQKQIAIIKPSSPSLSQKEIRSKAKETVHKSWWEKCKCATIGTCVGLLVGAAAVGSLVFFPVVAVGVAGASAGVAAAGGIGGVVGGAVEYMKSEEKTKKD